MHTMEEMLNRQMHRWELMSRMTADAESAPFPEAAATGPTRQRHPVITISRQLGSGARQIAAELARRLNYDLVGKTLIEAIATDLHVQRRLIDSLDERLRNELELMLESFMTGRQLDRDEYLGALARVLRAVSLQGGVVIVGRGGAHLVGDQSALNILIVAPQSLRVGRIMDYEQIGLEAARAKLERCDREREQFGRRLFKLDVNDPVYYDLVLNTERLGTNAAVQIIERALAERGYPLAELAIPQRVTELAAVVV